MSLMKPQRQRRQGAGNAKPLKREPFPNVSQQALDSKLNEYCRSMGVKQAFHLYEYQCIEGSQAENPRALHKLSKLLEALLCVSPGGKIKYANFKASLVLLLQSWGHELLSDHFPNVKHPLLAGRGADALGVVLKHWRRCCASKASWEKFCSKLDDSQAKDMERLRKKMEAEPSPKRQLQAHVSDVSLDSMGFPNMVKYDLGSPSSKGHETSEDEPSQDDGSLDCSPPPCAKKEWREQAMKKPASMKRPASTSKGPSPKSSLAKGLSKKPKPDGRAKGPDTIHQDTLCLGGGKNQAYLQHVPGPGKNKRLIVAVTRSQASHTTKTHRELVEMLMPACKKEKACKSDVLAERAKLLEKFVK